MPKARLFYRSWIIQLILLCVVTYLPKSSIRADVIRPAPRFFWKNAAGTVTSLEQVRGQSVILVIAPNIKNPAFRHQLREIQGAYQALSAAHALAFVALTQSVERIPSNVPFVVVANGSQVASTYGIAGKFGIAIIGRDGNLDDLSTKPIAGQRIMDIINNSFAVQKARRR